MNAYLPYSFSHAPARAYIIFIKCKSVFPRKSLDKSRKMPYTFDCEIIPPRTLYKDNLVKKRGGEGVTCERFKMLGNVCGEYVDDARRKL